MANTDPQRESTPAAGKDESPDLELQTDRSEAEGVDDIELVLAEPDGASTTLKLPAAPQPASPELTSPQPTDPAPSPPAVKPAEAKMETPPGPAVQQRSPDLQHSRGTPTPQGTPPPAPEWKVLEPTDNTDPVPHEVWDAPTFKHWRVMAASLRGKLHAHKGLWRDDAFALKEVNDWAIVAVADGAGSALHSRVAARIACDESAARLQGLLTGFHLAPAEGDQPARPDLERLKAFLLEATRKAQAAILREAQTRRCSPKELNTTLLLVIHCPFKDRNLAASVQVGDGAVGLYTEGDTHKLLGVPDHGQYSSETCFLTTPHIEHSLANRVVFSLEKGIRAIAVMCDGVSDDFFPEDKRLIDLFVGNAIPDLKTRSGEKVWGLLHKDKGVVRDPRGGRALLDWLRYEKRGSSDDRTLVLLYKDPVP
jgi:hypothetical protein